MFFEADEQSVLKGGNATLLRVHDARATEHVDLLVEANGMESALEALRAASERDLEDHFRLIIDSARPSEGAARLRIAGLKVTVEAYVGTKLRHSFSVDLVTGSLMTAEPTVVSRASLVPSPASANVRVEPRRV